MITITAKTMIDEITDPDFIKLALAFLTNLLVSITTFSFQETAGINATFDAIFFSAGVGHLAALIIPNSLEYKLSLMIISLILCPLMIWL
jgi:hypothetical protein